LVLDGADGGDSEARKGEDFGGGGANGRVEGDALGWC
jgi:hypothetical protein